MTEVAETTNTGNKALATMAGVTSGFGIISTAAMDTFADKAAVLTALTNAVPLADNLNKRIVLANFIMQAVVVTDTATGEDVDAVRTVLLDADGTGYHAVSTALVSSLRDIVAVLGQPSDWPEPLPIIVNEEKGSKAGRKFFKVSLAPASVATDDTDTASE